MRYVLAVLISTICLASASGTSQPTAPTWEGKRQISTTSLLVAPLPVISTSTSSFNWWPYPLATTSALLPTTTETDPDDPSSSEVAEQSTADAPLFTGPVVTSSTQISDSVTLSSAASSQSSTGTSTPQITITALPPLSSPLRPSHGISAYPQPRNPLLFVPLFVILGLGIGIALGWYGYGYWNRRQQGRSDKRLAGPRYEGIRDADMDDNQKLHDDTEKEVIQEPEEIDCTELLLEQPHLHKGAGYTPDDAESLPPSTARHGVSAWSLVGLPVLQRSPLLPEFLGDLVRSAREVGGDNRDPDKDRDVSKTVLSPNAPTVFSSIASSDEDDEDYENVRRVATGRGTVNHRSIRRRLAEKLRLQFSPGHGFARRKSRKQGKMRGKTPELEEGVLLLDNSLVMDSPPAAGTSSLKRNKSRRGGSVLGHGRTISDFSIVPDDVKTPPRVYTLKDPGVSTPTGHVLQTNRTHATPLDPGIDSDFDDRYTPLPPRKGRSARKLTSVRSTRRRTETIDGLDGPPKFHSGMDTERHVLPTSPPLLNSPELESALFFGPSASPARHYTELTRSEARARLEYHASTQPERAGPSRGSPVRKGPLGPRPANKPLPNHSPMHEMDTLVKHIPPLDTFDPSGPLRRSTARASSLSPTKGGYGPRVLKQGRGRSGTLPPVPMSPKERYEARHTALEKVEAIVERSWSARLLQSSATPAKLAGSGPKAADSTSAGGR